MFYTYNLHLISVVLCFISTGNTIRVTVVMTTEEQQRALWTLKNIVTEKILLTLYYYNSDCVTDVCFTIRSPNSSCKYMLANKSYAS